MGIERSGSARRSWRRDAARELAAEFGGVVHRRDLRAVGISRDEVRSEVRSGRWTALGRHTIAIDTTLLPPAAGRPGSPVLQRPASWPASAAWAVWESGSGAVLDGVSALLLAGLTNYTEPRIFVTVPRGSRSVRLPGVALHTHRTVTPAPGSGLARARTEAAVINALAWAASDRQAALIAVLAVQQRMTTGPRLEAEAECRSRLTRRPFIRLLLRDVSGGVQALGELDFARLCRRYGIPEPSRQRVCRGPRGRIYLDVWWEAFGAGVEIDGVQHHEGLHPVADALRDNEMVLRDGPVLRIPSIGLLTDPQLFMRQVKELIVRASVVQHRAPVTDVA